MQHLSLLESQFVSGGHQSNRESVDNILCSMEVGAALAACLFLSAVGIDNVSFEAKILAGMIAFWPTGMRFAIGYSESMQLSPTNTTANT